MGFRVFLHAVCLFLAISIGAAAALAETAAEFYRGKVVKLVVGYGAGGGYDTYARMLAPHLEERLGATVVVENRPGGGGIVALNQVAAARPDGLTIMLISAGSAAFGQLTGAEGVRYDLNRIGFLGRVVDDKRTVLWSTRSPYRTVEDALRSPRPILLGAVSRTDTIAATTAFFAEALGLDIKIVAGYKGTKEVALAALRGEVDGFAVSDSSARRYLKDDGLTASVILSRERSNLLPDLPTVFEVVSVTEAQAWWIDYIDALMSLGRALITTPEIPDDRLTLLREAVRDVLTDPEVIEEANAKRRPLNYASAEAAKQRIDTVIGSLSEEQLANVRHVAQEKY